MKLPLSRELTSSITRGAVAAKKLEAIPTTPGSVAKVAVGGVAAAAVNGITEGVRGGVKSALAAVGLAGENRGKRLLETVAIGTAGALISSHFGFQASHLPGVLQYAQAAGGQIANAIALHGFAAEVLRWMGVGVAFDTTIGAMILGMVGAGVGAAEGAAKSADIGFQGVE